MSELCYVLCIYLEALRNSRNLSVGRIFLVLHVYLIVLYQFVFSSTFHFSLVQYSIVFIQHQTGGSLSLLAVHMVITYVWSSKRRINQVRLPIPFVVS